MSIRFRLRLPLAIIASVLPFSAAQPTLGQQGATGGEWRTYGGDLGNTHYSPLEQINAENFSKLTVAWRFKTDNLGPQPEFNLESTPLGSARMAAGQNYFQGDHASQSPIPSFIDDSHPTPTKLIQDVVTGNLFSSELLEARH